MEEQTNSHKFGPLTIACFAIVIVIESNRIDQEDSDDDIVFVSFALPSEGNQKV